jgi:hypothetical protein
MTARRAIEIGLLVGVASGIVAQAARWASPVSYASARGPVSIFVQRGPCFGPAKPLQVRIDGDGTVCYEGQVFALGPNERGTVHITREQLEGVLREFDRAGFSRLQDRYENYDVSDGSTDTLSVRVGGYRKTVRFYSGDGSTPRALYGIEDAIFSIPATQLRAEWRLRRRR